MYRIGYAINGIFNWDRIGLVYPTGAPGTWDEKQVRAPSLINAEDIYLMAYEGWNAEGITGIGLALAVERWLIPKRSHYYFIASQDQTSLTAPLEMYNPGLGVLTINQIRIFGSGFSLNPIPSLTIQPGETQGYPVSFLPTSSGSYEAMVLFNTDNQYQSEVIVYLHGIRL